MLNSNFAPGVFSRVASVIAVVQLSFTAFILRTRMYREPPDQRALVLKQDGMLLVLQHNRPVGDHQSFGDRTTRESLRHECTDLLFARAERPAGGRGRALKPIR